MYKVIKGGQYCEYKINRTGALYTAYNSACTLIDNKTRNKI